MLTIALIGFGPPESLRLLAALKSKDLRFTESGLGQLAEARRSGATATLIWGAAADGAGTAQAIVEGVEAGLTTVAILLHGFDFQKIDLSRGTVEFCFLPVMPEEILVRLTLARVRGSKGLEGSNVLVHGGLAIDVDRYEVTLDGGKVDLTFKEYELLKFLAQNPGRVFSREALLRSVWEYDYFGGTRTVDVHIRRLRSKIDHLEHRFVDTVWNVGYRFRSPDESGPEKSGAPGQ